MRLLFNKDMGWKLLSLTIAVSLWILVAREPETVTATVNAPFQYTNLSDDLQVSSDMPERARLEVRGPSTSLTDGFLLGSAVVLNLSKVSNAGERTFTLFDKNVKLPPGVSFVRAVPSQVTLRFERVISKSVPIRPRFASGPPPGYVVARTDFIPAQATVAGPESHLKAIDQVASDPIDISNVIGKSEMPIHINIGDPQVHLKTSNAIHVVVMLERKEMN